MKPLTPRQLELLLVIARENALGRSPSMREMARALGVASVNQISQMLGYLEARELIMPRTRGAFRSTIVTDAGRAALAAAGDLVAPPPISPVTAVERASATQDLARAAFLAGGALAAAAFMELAPSRVRAVELVREELERAFAGWWAAQRVD